MGGFIPGAGQTYDTGINYDLTQYAQGSPYGVKNVSNMPGGGVGSGYVKTGAPIAYNQGPFQAQKFNTNLFNKGSFGL
jgi:hypothetical protein